MIYKASFVLIIVTIASFVWSVGARALEFKHEVFVENDEITLADLVKSGSLPEEIEANLRAVSLGASPADDEEVVLTVTVISAAIRDLGLYTHGSANFVIDHAQIRIPNEVRVRRASVVFNETQFRSQLFDSLKLDCADCVFKITKIRIPPLLPGMDGLPWRINLQNQRIRGPFSVRVDYHKGSQVIGSEYVTGEVRILKNVAVLNKSVELGERIQPTDVTFQNFDTTFWNDSPLTQNELMGSKLRRSLRAQDPIQRFDIERERLIQKGETVEIHVVSGAVDIGMTGTAVDAGMMGDLIHVLNPQTKKQLSGVVVAKGIVELK